MSNITAIRLWLRFRLGFDLTICIKNASSPHCDYSCVTLHARHQPITGYGFTSTVAPSRSMGPNVCSQRTIAWDVTSALRRGGRFYGFNLLQLWWKLWSVFIQSVHCNPSLTPENQWCTALVNFAPKCAISKQKKIYKKSPILNPFPKKKLWLRPWTATTITGQNV